MSNRICKLFLCAMAASSLTLCSCHKMRTEGAPMNQEERIKRGYEVVSNYVKLNYEWDVDEYYILYRFIYKGSLVYAVDHRDDSYRDISGEGKSVSVWLDPETFEVVRVLKNQ